MPRVGRHPLKQKSIKEKQVMPKEVTMTTIIYIPSLDGYWRESFDVLKIFFKSLTQNTKEPFDLMVFDNGSCKDVLDYLINLRDQGVIQYLILSDTNLRKLGALNYLLQAAPGKYISYADSDVYFLPGWLEESLKILDIFPEAAKVTALPIVGGDTTQISKSSYQKAKNDPSIQVETGILVPEKYIKAHMESIGKTIEQFKGSHPDRCDTKFTRKNTSVFLSGADFQFTIKKEGLNGILPLTVENQEDYYDPIYSPILEMKLHNNNLWQLSTEGYFVHHLGNTVPEINKELPWVRETIKSKPKSNIVTTKIKFLQSWYFRIILKKLNSWSYKKLYD